MDRWQRPAPGSRVAASLGLAAGLSVAAGVGVATSADGSRTTGAWGSGEFRGLRRVA